MCASLFGNHGYASLSRLLWQISYCQGMSDLASPILAVMDNEAHAFICFCGIMKRLGGNFRPDGQLMSLKFQHLKLLLRYSDPEFYSYLVSRGADDLFFCYRWLLLELKREFAFDDALRMLEITWSSLPPDPPETEVELLGPASEVEVEVEGVRGGEAQEAERCSENGKQGKSKAPRRHMLRPLRSVCADAGRQDDGSGVAAGLERQASFGEFKYYTTRNEDAAGAESPPRAHAAATAAPRRQSTLDSEEDPGERTPLIRNCGNGSSPASSPLFRVGLPAWKAGAPHCSPPPAGWPAASPEGSQSFPRAAPKVARTSPAHPLSSLGTCSPTAYSQQPSPPGSTLKACSLPPPQEFGRGNPFMLFLCLSILLEHRDHIIKNCLDYNELAMHFDRLVRRHNLSRVLQRAKALFADYLQSEIWDSEEGDEAGSDSPASAAPPSASSAPGSPLSSPCSAYDLATTVASPAAQVCYSSTL